MAQFYTDFSNYTDASFAADWAAFGPVPDTIWNLTIEDVSGATGGKVVRFARPEGQTPRFQVIRRKVPIDASTGPTDILLRVRAHRNGLTTSDDGTTAVFDIGFRGSYNVDNLRTAYALRPRWDGNVVLFAVVNGVWTGNLSSNSTSLSWPQFSFSPWVWIRIQADGNTLRWRWWENTEPDTWTASVTNSEIASGEAIFIDVTNTVTREFDVFAVGTNGDPAPTSPIITGPEITSTTKLQQAQSLTITGSSFGSAAGDNGIVVISPTDDIDGEGAVTQEVSSWSATSLTIESVDLPAGYSPGGTAYLFVRNDALEENEAGYEIKIADFALRVNETIRDTDSGGVVNETVEAVVIRGTTGNREVLFVKPGASISSGVLEMTDSTLTVHNYNQTKHVALIGSGNRMALLPATVVDRNDD